LRLRNFGIKTHFESISLKFPGPSQEWHVSLTNKIKTYRLFTQYQIPRIQYNRNEEIDQFVSGNEN